jgi:hypothetical protein
MLTKMVEDDEGCNVGVECLGIAAEAANPCVVHYSLDEDLDAALSSLVGLIVFNQGGPGNFDANAVDARSFRVDCWVMAGWMGGWAYEESAVVVKIPIHTGNKSPEVVDAIDAVIGGLEKDKQNGIGETDKIIVGGLSIDGEEERLGCCEG